MFLYDLELALAGWSRLSAFSFLSIIIFLFRGATPDSRSEKTDWSGHIDGVPTCTVPLRPKKPPSLLPSLYLIHGLRPFNIRAYFRPPSLILRSPPCPIRYLIKQEKNFFSSNPSEITGSPLCFIPPFDTPLYPQTHPPENSSEEVCGSVEMCFPASG
jgi:hypothetical protein